jgi:hypothetical protein
MGNRGRELLELASGPEPIDKFESGSSCGNADQYHGGVAQFAARSSIGIQGPGRRQSNWVRDVVSRPGPIGIRAPLGSDRAIAQVFLRLPQLQVWRPLSVSLPEVKKKGAVIQDLRASRERFKWLRSPLRALREYLRRTRL